MTTVTEVTHQGSYFNRREVEMSEITAQNVRDMVESCAYVYTLTPAKVEALADDLRSGRQAEHGWTRWTVTRKEEK